MLAVMRAHAVQRLFCPPLVLDQLAQAAATAECPPLVEIMTAGEQLRLTDDIRELLDRLPGVRLDNQYGPTEAHVITAYLMTGDPAQWPATPPVGAPIANTRVYVLDDRGNPAPAGVPGELYVGGACLARGYRGRPDLTAELFVPDPFGSEPGARLYRTGDLVRWRDDGTLDFLGRVDHQVKIRGYRIEPGEIEVLLAAHPDVSQAVVAVAGNLVGYVSAAPGRSPDPAELRRYLVAKLPKYMVPSTFVTLDEFPHTTSGKIDRDRLPRPAIPESGRTAPRNAREEAITKIWMDVLRTPAIGVDDDFFESGGHSLIAGQILLRINEEFSIDLPLSAIFQHTTIATLAEVVEAGTESRTVAAPHRPASR